MKELRIADLGSAARTTLVGAFFLLAFSGYGSLGGTAILFVALITPLIFADHLTETIKRFKGLSIFVPLILSIGLSWYFSRIPSISSKYTASQLAIILTVQILALSLGANISSILRVVALLVLASNIIYLGIHPSTFLSPTGAYGFYNGKNALGAFIGVLILIFLNSRTPKLLDRICLLACAILLALSKSTTTVLAVASSATLVAMTPGILATYRKSSPYTKTLCKSIVATMFFSIMLSITVAMFFLEDIAFWLLKNLPNSLFTGRGEIWRIVLRASSDSLLTGIGPGVFWGAGPQSEVFQSSATYLNPLWLGRLTSADGGYIDLIGSIGVLGFWAMTLLCLAAITQGVTRINEPAGKLHLSFVFFAIIHNITETSFLNGTHLVWILFIYSTTCLLSSTKTDSFEIAPNRQRGEYNSENGHTSKAGTP